MCTPTNVESNGSDGTRIGLDVVLRTAAQIGSAGALLLAFLSTLGFWHLHGRLAFHGIPVSSTSIGLLGLLAELDRTVYWFIILAVLAAMDAYGLSQPPKKEASASSTNGARPFASRFRAFLFLLWYGAVVLFCVLMLVVFVAALVTRSMHAYGQLLGIALGVSAFLVVKYTSMRSKVWFFAAALSLSWWFAEHAGRHSAKTAPPIKARYWTKGAQEPTESILVYADEGNYYFTSYEPVGDVEARRKTTIVPHHQIVRIVTYPNED